MSRLIVILGDQLTPGLPSLRAGNPARDLVVMGEVVGEATYARHHKKKLAFIFACMRRFARELEAQGWRVDYARLDDPEPAQSFTDLVGRALSRGQFSEIAIVEPGEWRVLAEVESWPARFGLPLALLEDDRFFCSRSDFARWAKGRRELRLEYFYRDLRRQTGLLMDAGEPAGGRWNYDAENRKGPPPGINPPAPPRFEPDALTRAAIDLVATRFAQNFGDLEPFWFATARAEAEAARDWFFAHSLPHFGDYQDAMAAASPFLHHAVLSHYLNIGLLDARDLCARAEAAWRAGAAPLNAAEGFIRQILGWREFVRGVYWLEGPDYVRANALGARRPLPAFYWTAETDMACMRAAISTTRAEAYAHHIQRLMVTGNFALLAGVDPHEVHEWYLGVYADAYEWVEAPNVIGMSQYADGGRLGSKPYAASGAYIDRMSDYCGGCRYDPDAKTGPGACPFNALYWDFLIRNEKTLGRNPRIARAYQTFARMSAEKQAAYRRQAAETLAKLDAGERI